MGQRIYQPLFGSTRKGIVLLFGKVVLGASGAISSQTGAKLAGFTVEKTATKTGRYTLTLDKNYNELLYGHVTVVGADDAAYTTAAGIDCIIRDVDTGGGAGDGTFELQLTRSDTSADAEAINSAELRIFIAVCDSSVT